MTYYYLNNKRILDEIPFSHCWVSIAAPSQPSPQGNKKKLTKDEKDNYLKQKENHEETLKSLRSGHINCYNQPFEPQSIIDVTRDIVRGYDHTHFRIEPTAAMEHFQQYSNSKKYTITEANVVTEVLTLDELISQAIKDQTIINVAWSILDSLAYSNEGYKDRCIEAFKLIHNKTQRQIPLDKLLFKNPSSYYDGRKFSQDNYVAKELINYFIDNNYVTWVGEYCGYNDLLKALTDLDWHDITLKCLHSLSQNELDDVKRYLSHDVKKGLNTKTDNDDVFEITKMLGIQLDKITLEVTESYNDGYSERIKETKKFNTMGELRKYLIVEYDVSFEESNKNIEDIYANDYSFKLVDNE